MSVAYYIIMVPNRMKYSRFLNSSIRLFLIRSTLLFFLTISGFPYHARATVKSVTLNLDPNEMAISIQEKADNSNPDRIQVLLHKRANQICEKRKEALRTQLNLPPDEALSVKAIHWKTIESEVDFESKMEWKSHPEHTLEHTKSSQDPILRHTLFTSVTCEIRTEDEVVREINQLTKRAATICGSVGRPPLGDCSRNENDSKKALPPTVALTVPAIDPTDPSDSVIETTNYTAPLLKAMDESAPDLRLVRKPSSIQPSKELHAVRQKVMSILPKLNGEVPYTHYNAYQYLSGDPIKAIYLKLSTPLRREWDDLARDLSLAGFDIGTLDDDSEKLGKEIEKTLQNLTRNSGSRGSAQIAGLQKKLGILNRLKTLSEQWHKLRLDQNQIIQNWQNTPEWKVALDAAVKRPNSAYWQKDLVTLTTEKSAREGPDSAFQIAEAVAHYDPFFAIFLAFQLPESVHKQLLEKIKFTPESRRHANRLTDASFYGTKSDNLQRRLLLGLLDKTSGLKELGISGAHLFVASKFFFTALIQMESSQSQMSLLSPDEIKVIRQLRKILARFHQRASVEYRLTLLASTLDLKGTFGPKAALEAMLKLSSEMTSQEIRDFLGPQSKGLLTITNTGDERTPGSIWGESRSGTLLEKTVPTAALADPDNWFKMTRDHVCGTMVRVYGFLPGNHRLSKNSPALTNPTDLQEEWFPSGHERHAIVLAVEKQLGDKKLSRSELHLPPQNYGTCWYRSLYGRIRQTLVKSLGVASYKKIARLLKQNMVAELTEEGQISDESRELIRIAANKVYAAQLREERYQIANDDDLYSNALAGPFKLEVRQKLIDHFKLKATATDQTIQAAALAADQRVREKNVDNPSEYVRKRAEILQFLIPKPIVIRRVKPLAKNETAYLKSLDQSLALTRQALDLKSEVQRAAAISALKKWMTEQYHHVHSIYYPHHSGDPGDKLAPFQYEDLTDRMQALGNMISQLNALSKSNAQEATTPTLDEVLANLNIVELEKATNTPEFQDGTLLYEIHYFVKNGRKSPANL